MHILFISNFNKEDYLNDVIYHGLIDSQLEVYEIAHPSFMLSSYPTISKLYGRGFTIYGKLNHTPNVEDSSTITQKIESQFYDVVIYGSITRCRSYFELVTKCYPRNKIHLVDGEDTSNLDEALNTYGILWKRELINGKANPISLAIPESQLISYIPSKEKIFANIIPGDKSTYIYSDEHSYYNDYAISYYGRTKRKASWESFRHYEILANRCVPAFENLENCPPTVLTTYPKHIILETNKFANKNEIPTNYDEINEELFQYTKKELTTKKLVERFLQ